MNEEVSFKAAFAVVVILILTLIGYTWYTSLSIVSSAPDIIIDDQKSIQFFENMSRISVAASIYGYCELESPHNYVLSSVSSEIINYKPSALVLFEGREVSLGEIVYGFILSQADSYGTFLADSTSEEKLENCLFISSTLPDQMVYIKQLGDEMLRILVTEDVLSLDAFISHRALLPAG